MEGEQTGMPKGFMNQALVAEGVSIHSIPSSLSFAFGALLRRNRAELAWLFSILLTTPPTSSVASGRLPAIAGMKCRPRQWVLQRRLAQTIPFARFRNAEHYFACFNLGLIWALRRR